MTASTRTLRRSRVGRHKAVIAAAPSPAEHVQRQQLEKLVTWSSRERLRLFWYRLLLVAQELNYASRRMMELQMRLPDDWGVRSRGQRDAQSESKHPG